jgi:FlaA1/EpsC-like NDP-sugar epimerase
MGLGSGVELRKAFFRDSVVCVTGAAGNVGRELLHQLLALQPREVRALDNDENGLFELAQDHRHDPRLRPIYCDISLADQVDRCLRGCRFVFHTAAVKHVPGCEIAPWAAVDVNIRGLSHVVDAALRHDVERLLFTSSDKAVNPTNVMGASKLMGEKLALASHMANGRTIIACTRFGNVAGTRGSVIPVFCEQIRNGGPITLTSPDMTRFFMSLEEAGSLVIDSMMSARNGEIFVTRMCTMRIEALARVLKRLVAPSYGRLPGAIETVICGLRPGEKMHEELITDEEARRSFATREYIVVTPLARQPATFAGDDYPLLGEVGPVDAIYHSGRQPPLADPEIEAFLLQHHLLPEPAETRHVMRRRIRALASVTRHPSSGAADVVAGLQEADAADDSAEAPSRPRPAAV